MKQYGASDSVNPVDQNQRSESSGSGPDERTPLTIGTGRSAESAPEPRFGISHMMVWIACCGVYMGIMRFSWPEALPPTFPPTLLVGTNLGSLSGGAYLAGIILFVGRRFDGEPYPLHPGEWLLTVQGITTAITLAMFVAATRMPNQLQSLRGHSTVLTCWLFLCPAFRSLDAKRWKLLFWSLVVVGLFRGLDAILVVWMGGIVRVIVVVTTCLWLVVLSLGCIWKDRQVQVRRCWTHWAGVLAFLWGNLIHVVALGLYVVGSYFG